MAKAREIQKRRKAVRNIHKITKVMQMIATSRFQKSLKRAKGTRPFAQKLQALVDSMLDVVKNASDDLLHPLLKSRDPKRTAVLIVTSNRGLAGGYNSNILRTANVAIRELEQAGQDVDIYVAGKKGAAYFRFARRDVKKAYVAISDNARFEEIVPIADELTEAYSSGQIDALKLVYMKFYSVGRQKPVALDILPLARGKAAANGEAGKPSVVKASPDFAPEPGELLADLVPSLLQVSIFQAFVDAAVSEQIARMVAMSAATENAESMTRLLTREYNRARQSQITSELSELMGGVEALN